MTSPDQMAGYRDRWKAVEEIEKQELRSASIELRWKQLNALFNLARELGIRPVRDEDEMVVIERWARLKHQYEHKLAEAHEMPEIWDDLSKLI